jgi:hypothetical protein
MDGLLKQYAASVKIEKSQKVSEERFGTDVE